MRETANVTGFTPSELAAWKGMLRVHSSLFHKLDAELEAEHRLSLRAYEALVALESEPDQRLRMSDLSHSAMLSPSGVSRLVDRLEADGLVQRQRCSDDRRSFFASLTDEGRRRLEEARATHLGGVRRLFLDRFAPEELDQLAAFWQRVDPGSMLS